MVDGVPTALPSDRETQLGSPDAVETAFVARGLVSAVTTNEGLRPLQATLIEAMCEAMTGHKVDPWSVVPIDAVAFAEGLERRNLMFRSRVVDLMLITMLVLVPLPEEVCVRVAAFADELNVVDDVLRATVAGASASLGIALIDFERNGYSATWTDEDMSHLHVSAALKAGWEFDVDDEALAARWSSLERCSPGSLGRGVFEFYRSRGFSFPGLVGSAPPLLAQHDWVHVLADYGTTLEAELEVFMFIARANADPRAFSLVAMVISLFETGALADAAGLFQADSGHLSQPGMAARLADAMRRGALTSGDPDFLRMDWFARADQSIVKLRGEFGIVDKGVAALDAGSVGPWERGGISPFQLHAGAAQALAEGRPYSAFGASLA